MIVALAIILLALGKDVSSHFDPSSSVHLCEVGDVIQNGRVTCTCSQDHVYECTFKKYADLTYASSREDVGNILACQPHKIYVHDTSACICNSNGTWPHSACSEIFASLPSHDIVKTRCDSSGYAFVDCNVCRCDTEGNIDPDRCTKNECVDAKSPKRRRSSKSSNVYGSCQAKTWYSLAPCQFCFCINENKLVCNTGNYFNKKLQLGSYNLSVCGKELIREAIELIPDKEQSLRHGEPAHTTDDHKPKPKTSTYNETTLIPPPVTTTTVETTNVEIEVKRESSSQPNLESLQDSFEKLHENAKEAKDEEYSESLEDSNRVSVNTQMPQEDYKIYSKESRESGERAEKVKKDYVEPGGNTDNEVLHPGLRIPVTPSDRMVLEDTKMVRLDPLEELGKQITENLPMVLSKVFNLALRRKAVISIDKNATCAPGAVTVVKCNTCFCLKNNKLLCTTNRCE